MTDDEAKGLSRRAVLRGGGMAAGGAAMLSAGLAGAQEAASPAAPADPRAPLPLRFRLNGEEVVTAVDPRRTILEWLREEAGLTGTKVGCNHGQCGACTIHVGGEPRLACLTLAMQVEGREVTTIEGLARRAATEGVAEDGLHPVQAAFIRHDALQCGYCTPGQVMSAVATIEEGHATTPAEVREYMSGNLCRCAAYAGIQAAVLDAAGRMPGAADGSGARQDFHLGTEDA